MLGKHGATRSAQHAGAKCSCGPFQGLASMLAQFVRGTGLHCTTWGLSGLCVRGLLALVLGLLLAYASSLAGMRIRSCRHMCQVLPAYVSGLAGMRVRSCWHAWREATCWQDTVPGKSSGAGQCQAVMLGSLPGGPAGWRAPGARGWEGMCGAPQRRQGRWEAGT